MRGRRRVWTICLLLLAGGCALGRKDKVAFDESFALSDGEAKVFPLEPGSYRLELTSDGEDSSVEWSGGECPRTEHTALLTMQCRLFKEGQLVVRNPVEVGAGGQAQLKVKLVRLARDI